jgi:hypothetical protein
MIYVMHSVAKCESKIGISDAPHARASSLRREHADPTIRLICCWNYSAPTIPEEYFEVAWCHSALERAGQWAHGEWFSIPWPAAVALVEQIGQLLAPLGVRLYQVPGAHR